MQVMFRLLYSSYHGVHDDYREIVKFDNHHCNLCVVNSQLGLLEIAEPSELSKTSCHSASSAMGTEITSISH